MCERALLQAGCTAESTLNRFVATAPPPIIFPETASSGESLILEKTSAMEDGPCGEAMKSRETRREPTTVEAPPMSWPVSVMA